LYYKNQCMYKYNYTFGLLPKVGNVLKHEC
jgi:hypothetical protein